MKKRLLFKILAGYIFIVLLIVSVMGYMTAQHIKTLLTARSEGDLAAFGRLIALMSRSDLEKNAHILAGESRSRITLIDRHGRVTLDTERAAGDLENHLHRQEIRQAGIEGQGTSIRYSQTLRMDMLYYAVAVREGGETAGYIRLARPLVEPRAAASQVFKITFKAMLIVLAPSMFVAAVIFFRIASPIREIESYTRKVSKDDERAMLMIESDDEIGSLSRNISNMVQFQQEKIDRLEEEKGKLEATFSSMLEGVMVLDGNNKIESCNDSMMKIAGPMFQDVIGKTPIEVLRSASLQDALNQFLQTNEPVTREITVGVDSRMILEVSISAITNLPGGERKIMMVFHDVTQLRKLERIRADFVANVTHELKTPLTALVGFSETLLKERPDRETMKSFLEKINDNAHRLDRLIDDLLTISNIESGETKLNPGEIALAGLVEEVLPLVNEQAKDKGLVVVNKVPGDFPPLHADKDKVFQALLNVIENAVKFTHSGRVEITASAGVEGFSVIRVTDTGIGIPKGEIPRLGERFYRVDKTRSRDLGGTGLGLSIVKHLMKLHQGRIIIDSAPGIGTTVSLYFPEDKKGVLT